MGKQLDDTLPTDVQRLAEETIEIVRAHPQHEMGQHQRKKIYDALWTTRRGQKAFRWLAVLASRLVQPMYEDGVSVSGSADLGFEEGRPVIGLVDRMIRIAEGFAAGTLTRRRVAEGMESGEIEDFCYTVLNASRPEFPYVCHVAASAAYDAIGEAQGMRPLQEPGSTSRYDKQDNDLGSSREDEQEDSNLAGSGGGYADSSVHAAYAFAGIQADKSFESSKLLEFWEWWLTDALEEAWQLAGEQTRPPS